MGGAIASAAQDVWDLLVHAWNAPWGPFAGAAAVLIALLFLKRGKLLEYAHGDATWHREQYARAVIG
jgi:hypothetical protein